MTTQTVQTLLENEGYAVTLAGEADSLSLVTFAVAYDDATIPLYVTWIADKALWRLSSFPHEIKRPRDISKLLTLYAALDLIPVVVADGKSWQIGAARYVADVEEGFVEKAVTFLTAIQTLHVGIGK